MGLAALEDDDRGKFNSTYVCPNPQQTNRGYASWDEFFTREILADARPMVSSRLVNQSDSPGDGLMMSRSDLTAKRLEYNQPI
jgi:hypothetical protein